MHLTGKKSMASCDCNKVLLRAKHMQHGRTAQTRAATAVVRTASLPKVQYHSFFSSHASHKTKQSAGVGRQTIRCRLELRLGYIHNADFYPGIPIIAESPSPCSTAAWQSVAGGAYSTRKIRISANHTTPWLCRGHGYSTSSR